MVEEQHQFFNLVLILFERTLASAILRAQHTDDRVKCFMWLPGGKKSVLPLIKRISILLVSIRLEGRSDLMFYVM